MENKDIIAVVAGEEITNDMFEEFVNSVPQEQKAYISNPQFRERLKEQFISLFAYAKYGEELKLEETEQFKTAMENARRDLLARMAMDETLKGVTVDEQEMKDFYESNIQHFYGEEKVSAKHILVKEEKDAQELLELIQNGKSFEEAAQECSTCPSGSRGGDLGEFGRGQMVKEFEDAAFGAEIDALVGPVKTQFGYHLIKVEDKKEAATLPFEEVKDRIEQMLLPQKQNKVYSKKYAELKEKYVK